MCSQCQWFWHNEFIGLPPFSVQVHLAYRRPAGHPSTHPLARCYFRLPSLVPHLRISPTGFSSELPLQLILCRLYPLNNWGNMFRLRRSSERRDEFCRLLHRYQSTTFPHEHIITWISSRHRASALSSHRQPVHRPSTFCERIAWHSVICTRDHIRDGTATMNAYRPENR